MFNNNLNVMIQRIKPSKTLEMLSYARKIEASGKSVIHMELGEPDVPSPETVKQATINAINDDFTHYTVVRGMLELREKILKYFQQIYSVNHYTANSNIIITPGAKVGLFYSLVTILNEGDEVILPAPIWGTYAGIIRYMGAKPVFVDIYSANNELDINAISSAINNKTKIIVANFPSNPTSQIITKDSYKQLTELIIKNQFIYFISDEIYNELSYDGNLNSFTRFKEIKDQLILISGFSKSHSMTGYRLGYVIAPETLINKFTALQGNGSTCAASFVQKAGIAALDDRIHIKKARGIYHERAKLVYDLISEIKNVTLKPAQASFYAFPKIEGAKDNFTMEFLKNKYVAGTPGSAFGPYYNDFMRLSFATSEENIREGLKRLKTFVTEYTS